MTGAAAPPPPRSRLKRALVLLVSLLVVVIVLWWTLAFFLQRTLLFPRGFAEPSASARAMLGGLVDLTLPTPDGEVVAWLVPAPGASAAAPAPLVLFAHGNAELIDQQVDVVRLWHALGCSVLLPEYRGYGRSAGAPSQEALVGDAAGFLAQALARPDVDGTRVVFHGRSVGAGVVCSLAERRAPNALVLESAFRSVAAMAAPMGVPRFLVRDPFDNEAVLARLDVPALLFHGRCDSIVPFAHAERLAAVAKRATLVAYDCDHNDLPPDPPAHAQRIAAFARAHGIVR